MFCTTTYRKNTTNIRHVITLSTVYLQIQIDYLRIYVILIIAIYHINKFKISLFYQVLWIGFSS